MKTGIYAVRDKVAGAMIGGLHLHRHDAAAVRMFDDIARMENSQIGRHPQDFHLLKLGHVIDDEGTTSLEELEGGVTEVLDGAAWAAMQQPRPE